MKTSLIFTCGIIAILSNSALAHDNKSATSVGDALAWYKNSYVVDFINDAPDFYAHYTDQIYFATKGMAQLLTREDLIKNMDKSYVQPWSSRGWVSSRMISAKTEALNEFTAQITATWAFENKAGEAVTDCKSPTWHYIVMKNDTGWKITTEIQASCPD